MAVYEKSYRGYDGARTDPRWRFMTLPRYAFERVFASRLFGGFFALCFVCPVVVALWIYLPHNLKFLQTFGIEPAQVAEFFRFDGLFFLSWYMKPQLFMSFLVAMIIGPSLIADDLRNNALPLYFSRPFSRAEYVLGKSAVLITLLSLVTWIPGSILFLLQASLGGWSWLSGNWRVGVGILVGSWIWIVLLCLLSLALSAHLRWKPLAHAAMFGVFFVAAMVAGVLNFILRTDWGSLIDIGEMTTVVWASLFGVSRETTVPAAAAWLALFCVAAACLALLSRRLKAYEVVRS